jgi:hypothetical protein
MYLAEDFWNYYTFGQLIAVEEKTIADAADEVMEELKMDSTVLDAFPVDREKGLWCLDLTGNSGEVWVDLSGLTTMSDVKQAIRTRLCQVSLPTG